MKCTHHELYHISTYVLLISIHISYHDMILIYFNMVIIPLMLMHLARAA